MFYDYSDIKNSLTLLTFIANTSLASIIQ